MPGIVVAEPSEVGRMKRKAPPTDFLSRRMVAMRSWQDSPRAGAQAC